MTATEMNHFTVLPNDLENSVSFYTEILGLEEGFRPNLGFPGCWLYKNQRAILHIISGKKLPSEPSGVLDHMAFSAENLPETIDKLKTRKIDYELKRQNETNTWQLFFVDPNGAKVELDFDSSEKSSA